jgi:glutaconyl-CoA/methylmalonyl-CoA decarboxylase subunit gamma
MDHLRITVEGKVYDVLVEKIETDDLDSSAPPARSSAPPARASTPAPSSTAVPTAAATAVAGPGDVTSPLAGIVQAIETAVGKEVAEGDLVITLEAMKMYTPINALTNGTIQAIHVKVGDAVDEGQILYTIS